MSKILDFRKKSLKILNIIFCTVLFWTLSGISNFLIKGEAISLAAISSSSGNTGYEPWYYYIADVVNATNGNLYLSYNDISIKVRGFNIGIVRAYNSLNKDMNSPFGYGWTFNYHVYLVEQSGQVTLVEGDSSTHVFTDIGGGNYSSPAGVYSKLKKDAIGFLLFFKNGITYRFNLNGKLLNTVDKNGNTLTFNYASGKLTGITDDSGLSLTIYYDAQNRISSIVDPLSRQITYSYDVSGNLTTVTDAMGNPSKYLYYANHRLQSSINEVGAMLYFEYYPLDNTLQEIKTSLYDFGSGTYPTPLRLYLISYGFNLAYLTDALGRRTTIQLNASGNPIRITDPLYGIWMTSWDSDMNITSTTDAKSHTYNYTYDSYGNLLSQTDPLTHSTTNVWQNINTDTQYISLLRSVTDTRGYTTSFAYDAKGNLTQITNAKGHNFLNYYDTQGFVIRQVDFRGYETLYSYDTHGNMISLTDALGKVTTCNYDLVGRLLSITDPLLHTTSYQYDANDRVTKITDALAHETTYAYNAVGSLINTRDAENNVTALSHNIIGKADKTTDALNNQTSLTFDRTGNTTKITDAKNNPTTPSYDALGRLISVTDALGRRESYTYDAVGNVLTKRDKNSNTITYGYDQLNRLISISYSDASSVAIQYDAEGNITQITNTGGIGEIANYSYDELNRLISVAVNYGSFTKTVSYTYDANGNQITMTDPNSGVTTYVYDEINRLTSITDPSSNTATYEYDDASRRIRVNKPNGTYTIYAYDAINRLSSLENKKSTAELISGYSYTYDNVGNRLTMTDSSGTTSYQYDALYRLTNVTYPGPSTTQYTYDAVGNRLTQTAGSTITYTYDAANRLLSTSDGTTYAYDNNGSLISKTNASGTTAYQYDYENRLKTVILPDTSQVTYKYSALGNRLSKTAGGITRHYLYDSQDILMEMDTSGGQIARYTHGPRIDEPISINRAGAVSYYHYDGLGSVTSLTNASGDVVATYQYDAFGNITNQTGTVENPYKFTAREYEPESGLYYYRVRYYAPDIGRFLQPDPTGHIINPYIYVRNNPVNWVDPYGLQDTQKGLQDIEINRYDLPHTLLGGSKTRGTETKSKVLTPREKIFLYTSLGVLGIATVIPLIIICGKPTVLLILGATYGVVSYWAIFRALALFYCTLTILMPWSDEPLSDLWEFICFLFPWLFNKSIELANWYTDALLEQARGGKKTSPVVPSPSIAEPFLGPVPKDITIPMDMGPWVPSNLKSVPSGGGNSTESIDTDGDGVADFHDNCPDTPNPGQEDRNGNGIGDACEGGGGGGCFLAGTPILMADGSQKPIEKIRKGDVVFSFDEATNELKPDKVTKVFRHPKEDTYLVVNNQIKITSIHPVLSKGKWVNIGNLEVGDMLTNTKGEDVPIKSIKVIKEKVKVYNLEVNPYHTYIADGIVVHNKPPIPPIPSITSRGTGPPGGTDRWDDR